jgi:hypothetical protein
VSGMRSYRDPTPDLIAACSGDCETRRVMSLPEIAWEASLGIYLIWKGFRPSPILDGYGQSVAVA